MWSLSHWATREAPRLLYCGSSFLRSRSASEFMPLKSLTGLSACRAEEAGVQGEAWSHTSLGPAGSALETGPARVVLDAASSLPRPTAHNPLWGCSLRTPPLVHTLHSALFPQPSPGARESWPGQGPAPSLDSLWSRLFLFLGLAGALSSSASRHPWRGIHGHLGSKLWPPLGTLSCLPPAVTSSSLCLSPLLLSFFFFF